MFNAINSTVERGRTETRAEGRDQGMLLQLDFLSLIGSNENHSTVFRDMAEAIMKVFAAKTTSQTSVVELPSLQIICATDKELAGV